MQTLCEVQRFAARSIPSLISMWESIFARDAARRRKSRNLHLRPLFGLVEVALFRMKGDQAGEIEGNADDPTPQ